MVRVKQAGRNGKIHFLPGPLAYTALCGKTDTKGDWMPIRDDVNIWGECIRCLSIRERGRKEASDAQ